MRAPGPPYVFRVSGSLGTGHARALLQRPPRSPGHGRFGNRASDGRRERSLIATALPCPHPSRYVYGVHVLRPEIYRRTKHRSFCIAHAHTLSPQGDECTALSDKRTRAGSLPSRSRLHCARRPRAIALDHLDPRRLWKNVSPISSPMSRTIAQIKNHLFRPCIRFVQQCYRKPLRRLV